MEVVEMLDNLKEKARRDPALREVLLATRRILFLPGKGRDGPGKVYRST